MCVSSRESHLVYDLEAKRVRQRGNQAKRTKKASQGGSWREGGKKARFPPPLTSSPLGHFALRSSPAERRLDWVEKECSQSRFYGIAIY